MDWRTPTTGLRRISVRRNAINAQTPKQATNRSFRIGVFLMHKGECDRDRWRRIGRGTPIWYKGLKTQCSRPYRASCSALFPLPNGCNAFGHKRIWSQMVLRALIFLR
jgi:hypothetical protein